MAESSLSLSLWRSNQSCWRGPPGGQNWVQWGKSEKKIAICFQDNCFRKFSLWRFYVRLSSPWFETFDLWSFFSSVFINVFSPACLPRSVLCWSVTKQLCFPITKNVKFVLLWEAAVSILLSGGRWLSSLNTMNFLACFLAQCSIFSIHIWEKY